MPALAGLPSQITSLAQVVAESLEKGATVRSSVGTKDAAFAWATGMPRTVADFVTTIMVEGEGFTALRVEPTGTPAAPYTTGTKPTAVAVTSHDVPVVCYAGGVSYASRKQVTSDSIAQAIVAGLVNSCLTAFETDAITTILADATATTPTTSWAGSILAGIGDVAAAGGTAGVLALAPEDLAAAVDTTSLLFEGSEAIPTVLGLRVHTSPALTPGTGLVLDPRAVMCGELAESPTVLASLTPLSNTVELAVDLYAATYVTNPQLVRSISVTPPVGRS